MENKAVRFHTTGGPEVLQWDTVPMAEAGSGEVVVRVIAAGLNYIDTYQRSGYYPLAGLPSPIGMEAAGEIYAIGPDVSGWQVGEMVAYVTGTPGACTRYHTVPADRLIRVPAGIAPETAAGMMLKGMTARYLLRETYPVQAGDTILVHAAAGGVGSILVQWAHHLGATVIGTVGSPEKAEQVRQYGCDHIIQYRHESVSQRVAEITDGAGVAVVYDSVGNDTFHDSLLCLRPRGMMVTFGQSSGAISAFDPVVLSQRGSLFLTRPTLFHYVAAREALEANAADLFAVVASGAVTIPVRHTYPMQDTGEAHRALQARETTGSVILVPGEA